MSKRKVCVITGTRAEYGLLYWLMKEIQSDKDMQLQLIVTGMHLSSEFGLTYKEIEKNFKIDKKVEMLLSFEILSTTEKNFTRAFLPNYFVQISQENLKKKLSALKCYKSEIAKHPFSRSLVNIKNLAMYRGSQSGNYYAEAFKIVRLIKKNH